MLTKDTKLNDILTQYPWILDEAVKTESKFRILKTPVGKLFLRNATIGELSARAGIDKDEIICQIQEWIRHKNH
ncbi:MAG: DUF1858 domain-containing protein [Parasporobacterium sp.]|nr:DUF1858 domain-containing protein [Parasporobacterium sp.]